ncbi:Fic family protein [Vreelandella titanicae]
MKGVYLAEALEQGVIDRTIPNKSNSRLQKNRLTDTGRQLDEN